MAMLLKSLQLIQDGAIQEPADYLYDGETITPFEGRSEDQVDINTRDCKGLLASAGWIDLKCGVGEPGLEYIETFESLGEVLKTSGFSQAVLLPNTQPAIQSKNEVEFVRNKTKDFFTKIHIQAAATRDAQGEDLTEILDIHHHGVNIFGDGLMSISNSDRMMKVLQYLQKFDGILFDHSYDPLLAIFGQMHEGFTSTRLGMKGIPSMAEEVAIQKNIEILRYTGGSIHFQTISTVKGVEQIRTAKKEGLNVTADVSLYQLLFSDEDLMDFNTYLKVVPPFRGKDEREAILEGLKDGTIDAIVSNHQPQDFDSKHMEFDLASSGMAGLQTFLPGLVQLEKELGWPLLIEKITRGPAKVLGEKAEGLHSLTVFDPNETWTYDKSTNKSLSFNSPYLNQTLTGKVKFVINGDKFEEIDG